MTCTYKNISGGSLWLQDEAKRQLELAVDEQFSGSSFFKRFVNSQMLELVSDDGSVWPTSWPIAPGSEGSGAVSRSEESTVAPGTTWIDNDIDVDALIGGPAYYCDLDTDVDVRVRINGDSASDFLLSASSIRKFDKGDILISRLQFDNSASGASTATVNVFVVGVPQ